MEADQLANFVFWSATLAMTLATYLTRVAPYVFLGPFRNSPILIYVGRYLPPTVMVLLVIYCLKDVEVREAPFGFPELVGVLAVTSLHLWRKNSLLSIFLGTAVYVVVMRLLG